MSHRRFGAWGRPGSEQRSRARWVSSGMMSLRHPSQPRRPSTGSLLAGAAALATAALAWSEPSIVEAPAQASPAAADDEDYEQSCMPSDAPERGGNNEPGRPAFASCNYTCMYLLAGLEPERAQVQVLHE